MRHTRPLELTPQKDVLFIIGDWNAKVGSQEILGVTSKFGLGIQNESGQRLIEFCQEDALVIANTLLQQHKRGLYTWTSPRWSTRKSDYILFRRHLLGSSPGGSRVIQSGDGVSVIGNNCLIKDMEGD